MSDGAGRGRSGVFKSSDQGESWDPVGLQGTTVHALALDPEHPGTMYAGTDSRGILKTADGGANWRDAGLNGQTITGLTLDPSNTDIVYATTPTWEGGVFKNEDGGPQPQLANRRRLSVSGDRPRVLHRLRARPPQPCDDLRRHERRPHRGGAWCLEEPRRRPQLATDERGSERRTRDGARPRAW